jgi:hypothetical protein
MAVAAHDIALGSLGQDLFVCRSPDHPSDDVLLRFRLPMIEVHRACGEPLTTVGARDVAQQMEQRGLPLPTEGLRLCAWVGGWRSSWTQSFSIACAHPVAVDAHDVALRDLCENALRRHEHGSTGHNVERFRGRIAVVEVHLIWLEATATVRTGNLAQFAKHLDHSILTDANTPELQLTIPTVVLDVVWSLVPPAHDPL